MSEYKIKCETIIRLMKILNYMPDTCNEWNNTIRLEDDLAIVTNRQILLVERLPEINPENPVHIIIDDKLKQQCLTESKFDSDLIIEVSDAYKYGAAKTTFGYQHPDNACLYSDVDNDIDKWRSIIPKIEAKKSVGAMFWESDNILNMAMSSPSGSLAFPLFIDINKPIVVRDINDDNWMAVFSPSTSDADMKPAILPEWLQL